MSRTVIDAARDVVAHWRLRPHAIIATDLRRAIEALDQALEMDAQAAALQAAHGRVIDHEAWSAVLNGHPKPEV